MDSKTLLSAYMRAKNLTSLTDAAREIGFSVAYICDINRGNKQFSDETVLYMAKELGLDTEEVLISLAAVKAKNPEVQAKWYAILKKYCAGTGAALAVACVMMGSLNSEPVPTAHNVYYVKFSILFPVTTY
ncbi:TPA: helix-turn-helix domain-containing protein [Aeromonas veronii]|uniref:transcriptional regulator n=1 Tax=Aeromonas veronii TaxID=654 RepID=UPI00191E0BA4|nr:transcriptional regulator [Aeromonas veronii]MBL0487591.1 transcriptional regulator [Aeromonas veronii]